MSNSPAPPTEKMTALYTLGERLDQKAVDWAVEMLVKGYDSPSLRILAGESEPFFDYQLRPLFERTLRELEIGYSKDRHEARIVLLILKCRQYVEGRCEKEQLLREISAAYYKLGMESVLRSLWLLVNAHDLLFDPIWPSPVEAQPYWPGITSDNFDQILREEAENWLAGNEGIFGSSGDTNPS